MFILPILDSIFQIFVSLGVKEFPFDNIVHCPGLSIFFSGVKETSKLFVIVKLFTGKQQIPVY